LTETGTYFCREKHKRNESEVWSCTMCVLSCRFTLCPLFISSFTTESGANVTLHMGSSSDLAKIYKNFAGLLYSFFLFLFLPLYCFLYRARNSASSSVASSFAFLQQKDHESPLPRPVSAIPKQHALARSPSFPQHTTISTQDRNLRLTVDIKRYSHHASPLRMHHPRPRGLRSPNLQDSTMDKVPRRQPSNASQQLHHARYLFREELES